MVVKKGYQLNDGRILPILGPEFEVRIDIKINSWDSRYQSIFRLSALTGNCCKIGQRALAMWARKPRNGNGRLLIRDALKKAKGTEKF